ncbi:MAG TPA: cell division protein FtsH, partial [Desulfomicrobiaceae bacterium]|nr:cell division protein FtsH [Desulfomicrobiaceae bacterium]
YSKTYLENNLAVLFGGRAAEELMFGEITTGAGNDIERATQMAKKMVCEWGMSEAFGPLALGKNDGEVFLGRDMVHHKDYSEETARTIDAEVKRIISEAYDKTRSLLQTHMDTLHDLSQALLERESLTGAEVELIMNGEKLPPAENKLNSAGAPPEASEPPAGKGQDAEEQDIEEQEFELEESADELDRDESPRK